jgi:hypothetical protein
MHTTATNVTLTSRWFGWWQSRESSRPLAVSKVHLSAEFQIAFGCLYCLHTGYSKSAVSAAVLQIKDALSAAVRQVLVSLPVPVAAYPPQLILMEHTRCSAEFQIAFGCLYCLHTGYSKSAVSAAVLQICAGSQDAHDSNKRYPHESMVWVVAIPRELKAAGGVGSSFS